MITVCGTGELLPEEDVPVEIKRAQPCMFHYTPPVVEAAASSTAAEEGQAEAGADVVKSGPNTPDHAAEPVAHAVVASAAAPVEADFAAETKKRKRIQPMVIAALGSEASAGASSSSSSAGSSSSTAAPVVPGPEASGSATEAGDSATAGAVDSALPKAVKKRIAPQLVQTDAPLPAQH
jgi:hypothetical protein